MQDNETIAQIEKDIHRLMKELYHMDQRIKALESVQVTQK